MRKIILDLAVTTHRFIERPNGEIDRLIGDDEIGFGDLFRTLIQSLCRRKP